MFLAAALAAAGMSDPGLASLTAFVVVAASGLGCVVGGAVADRFGRALTTSAAMAISGASAVVSANLFGAPAVQTAIGFLLTGVTIFAIGLIEPTDAAGWRLAWTLLAAGPLVGIAAMLRLRSSPDATKMASGRR